MFSKGFTIVEILVVMVVFILIISATLGIFNSILLNQKRVLAKQELLNQTSYVMEYMSRNLRFAKKDSAGSCLSQAGLNYENPGRDFSRIKFINHLEGNVCQEFFLNSGRLSESKDGGVSFPLLSDKIRVNSLKFKLFGESGGDSFQPRVTIFLDAQFKGTGNQPKIKLQTTISQRNLDE